jgi:CBS domain-containing protein
MKSPSELRAADIMARALITVRENASIREAAALLIDREISGAPVSDGAGRIIGLISLRDLARVERERSALEEPQERDVKLVPGITGPERRSSAPPNVEAPEEIAGRVGLPYGFHVEPEEPLTVREVMTPFTVTVGLDFDLTEVARTLLQHKIHRALVRDSSGAIVGLVSALDLVRALTELDALAASAG